MTTKEYSRRFLNEKVPISSLILPEPRKSQKSDKPLTSNERDKQMRNLAFLLQGLRDPKTYESFLHANGPSTNERLIWNSRKVIQYYTEPNRFLPLQPNIQSPSRHQGFVLQGPLLCHSLLTTILAPHFAKNQKKIPEQFSDTFLDMGLMTIRSIGELCSSKNPIHKQGCKISCMNSVCGSFLQLGELAEDLLRILLNMEYLFTSEGNDPVLLSKRSRKATYLFNYTLNTWAKIAASERDYNAAKNAALRGEKLLLDLATSHNQKNDKRSKVDEIYSLVHCIQPDTISFNSVIQSWSNSGRYDYVDAMKRDLTTTLAAERAEAILNLLQDMSGSGVGNFNFIHPNNISYDLAIYAWSRAVNPNASDRAMHILVSMLEKFYAFKGDISQVGKQPFPSRETFSSVLKALATSDRIDSVEKGEEMFRRMKRLGEQGYAQCNPDTIAYNSLLLIYLRKLNIILEAGNPSMSEMNDAYMLCFRMDNIVDEMRNMNSRKDKITKEKTSPDAATLRTVSKAWINLAMKGALSANTPCFEESLQKSDRYLRLLVKTLENETNTRQTSLGISPDKKLFDQLILVYQKVGDHLKANDFENYVLKSSGSVALSLSKDKIEELTMNASSNPENAKKADKILQNLNEGSRPNSSQPNAFMIRSVFNSYSKALDSKSTSSEDALKYIQRMEELLNKMEKMCKRSYLKKHDAERKTRTMTTASNVLL